MIARWMKDDVLERVQRLQPVADEVGLSLAQLAVAWVLQNPNVSSAIIGASRPEQVSENVKAAGVTLEPELMERIDEVVGDIVYRDASFNASPRSGTSDAQSQQQGARRGQHQAEHDRGPPALAHAVAQERDADGRGDEGLGDDQRRGRRGHGGAVHAERVEPEGDQAERRHASAASHDDRVDGRPDAAHRDRGAGVAETGQRPRTGPAR